MPCAFSLVFLQLRPICFETKGKAMTETDLIRLYSGRILELAAAIPHHQRLCTPGRSSHKRSAVCGSSLIVDVIMQNGRVAAFGQEVKACALGQASAAILGAAIIGRSHQDLLRTREALIAMLRDDGPAPAAPFAEYQVLIPARGYKNRHASILLPLDAACEATLPDLAETK
jgi:NifU-like protein involved in Fe-S cluster formation